MRAPPDQYIPQRVIDRRPLVMWCAVAVGAMAFVAAIVGAPLALAGGQSVLGLTIYQAFGHFCHQLPERSFFIAGHKFAVCARCTGIYAGFAAGVLVGMGAIGVLIARRFTLVQQGTARALQRAVAFGSGALGLFWITSRL